MRADVRAVALVVAGLLVAGCGGADAANPEPVEVGGTFDLTGRGDGVVTVSFDAFMWVDPELVDGEENFGIAVFSFHNDSDAPVELAAPIDGGSWHYLYADGEIESSYVQTRDWTPQFYGTVRTAYKGPFIPGTSEGGLVEIFVPSERGGHIVYLNHDREIEAYLVVPDETVNEDNESLQAVLEEAEHDGAVAERD